MSGLSRTPGKRVYGESRTVGSNPTLSATALRTPIFPKLAIACTEQSRCPQTIDSDQFGLR